MARKEDGAAAELAVSSILRYSEGEMECEEGKKSMENGNRQQSGGLGFRASRSPGFSDPESDSHATERILQLLRLCDSRNA